MPEIATLRRAGLDRLRGRSTSAALDVDLLLGHVLGLDRATILAFGERAVTLEQAAEFAALLERAAAGEPIAYLLGRRAFYDCELIVTPDVLIPRPETELLLEQALEYAHLFSARHVVDVGTGSGALAVTFAAHYPKATVYAIDICPRALDVARRNAEQCGVSKRVELLEGDLLEPLLTRGLAADLVLANLPYIASDEVKTLPVSRYEPTLALDGGPDGLDLIRRLLAQASKLSPLPKVVLLEIGADQGLAAAAVARTALAGAHVDLLHDYAGLDRIVRIKLQQT